ncbi:MAG TPA: ADYC domain-containing protein [Kofleriaceae bacterium]|nr:ADYC domain-containing protein [Kofleriaceae bacterium]
MKLALTVVLCFSACATDDLPPPDVTARIDCDTWACGTNSPTVGDGLVFDELDSSGRPNASGLAIVGAYTADHTPIQLSVKRDVLSGTSAWGRVYQGLALVGTIIKLHRASGGDYELLLARYNETSFWAGNPKAVPFFEIQARKAGDQKFTEYACKYDALTDDPYWTSIRHSAVVFEGDHYDPVLKTVVDTYGSTVFNVACAGTTPAKLHLLRHTNAGAWDLSTGLRLYPTTVAVRQTMLKLLTADYCGTGVSYTVDGTPLAYADSTGSWWMPGTTTEAIWGPSGAICLDTGRYLLPTSIACSLPACPDFADWSAYGEAMSENRLPTPVP